MKPLLVFFLSTVVLSPIFAQTEQNIDIKEGTIYLKTYGTGTPILIINGGPGLNSKGFEPLAGKLGENYKAIIYDQRGTGNSTIAKVDSTTITMDLMVSDIETIRKHLGLKKWVVFGHSFGGMLASYYASKYPHRIKGLILSASGGIDLSLFKVVDIRAKLTPAESDSLKYWTSKVAKGDTSYYARYQKSKFLAPAYLYNKQYVPNIAHRLTEANFTVNRLVFKNMSAINFNCSKGLQKLTAPTLIIQGKQDIIDISISKKANSVVKNSTLVVLDKCGHYGWLDQPNSYFKALNNFLSGLS